jgi:hypothetical protein
LPPASGIAGKQQHNGHRRSQPARVLPTAGQYAGTPVRLVVTHKYFPTTAMESYRGIMETIAL